MQTYAGRTQNKNAAQNAGSFSHGRTAGERSEGLSVQFDTRMEPNRALAFDDMRIHYSSPLPDERIDKKQAQMPVIQRYKIKIDKKVKQKELENQKIDPEVFNFGMNHNLYRNVIANRLSNEYFDYYFVPVFHKKNVSCSNDEFRFPTDNKPYRSFVESKQKTGIYFEVELEENDKNRLEEIYNTPWIKIPDFATGDQFTLAALLLKEEKYNVLIMNLTKENKTSEIIHTFEKTLGTKAISGTKGTKNEGLYVIEKKGKVRVVYPKKTGTQYPYIYKQIELRQATQVVGENYKRDEWGKELRKQWSLPIMTEDWEKAEDWKTIGNNIQDWIKSTVTPQEKAGVSDEGTNSKQGANNKVFDDLSRKDIVILWLRHSGANGGAHLEHDTGTAAMELLISRLLGNPDVIIILAGDRDSKNNQVKKLMEIDKTKIFDFTEFWKSGGLENWGGNTRFGQTRFYDFLATKARSLRHIGSRSGNLELMALIGHQVNYFEEENSYGGKRMEIFNASEELNYKRLLIERPLTFKGNLVRIANYIIALLNRQAGQEQADIDKIDFKSLKLFMRKILNGAIDIQDMSEIAEREITDQYMKNIPKEDITYQKYLEFKSSQYSLMPYQMTDLFKQILTISAELKKEYGKIPKNAEESVKNPKSENWEKIKQKFTGFSLRDQKNLSILQPRKTTMRKVIEFLSILFMLIGAILFFVR